MHEPLLKMEAILLPFEQGGLVNPLNPFLEMGLDSSVQSWGVGSTGPQKKSIPPLWGNGFQRGMTPLIIYIHSYISLSLSIYIYI